MMQSVFDERYKPKALWLWGQGSDQPDLYLVWRVFMRRFNLV